MTDTTALTTSYTQNFVGMMQMFSLINIKNKLFHNEILQRGQYHADFVVYWNPKNRIRTKIAMNDTALFIPQEREKINLTGNIKYAPNVKYKEDFLWKWIDSDKEIVIMKDVLQFQFYNTLDFNQLFRMYYRHNQRFTYSIKFHGYGEVVILHAQSDKRSKIDISTYVKPNFFRATYVHNDDYYVNCKSNDSGNCKSHLENGKEYDLKPLKFTPNNRETLIESNFTKLRVMEKGKYDAFFKFLNKTMSVRLDSKNFQLNTTNIQVTVDNTEDLQPAFTFPLDLNSTLKFYSKQPLGIQHKSRRFRANVYDGLSEISIGTIAISHNLKHQLSISVDKENTHLIYDEKINKKLSIQDEDEWVEVNGLQSILLSSAGISVAGSIDEKDTSQIVCADNKKEYATFSIFSNVWRIEKDNLSCEFYPLTEELQFTVSGFPRMNINLRQRKVDERFANNKDISSRNSTTLSSWTWTDKDKFTYYVRIMQNIVKIKFHGLQLNIDLQSKEIITNFGSAGWSLDKSLFARCDFFEAFINVDEFGAFTSIHARGHNNYVRAYVDNGVAALYKRNDTEINFEKFSNHVTLVLDETEVLIE